MLPSQGPHTGDLSIPDPYESSNQPAPRCPLPQERPRVTLLVNPQTLRRFDATKGYPGEGPPPPWQLLQHLTARINPAPINWAEVDYNPHEATQPTPTPLQNCPSWMGHDMSTKPLTTGLRLIHINIQQKGTTREDGTMFLEKILQYATTMQGDVVTIQEPGRISPRLGSLIKATAGKYGYQALILTGADSARKGEGLVVFLNQPWQQVYTNSIEWPTVNPVGVPGDRASTARIAQINFKAAHREPTPIPTPGITPKAPPLSQLAIFVVYGYSGGQNVKANRALLRTTHARIREYRKSTPWGSVLVVGDLNICLSNNLDTDRPDLPTDSYEPEAEVLQTFMREAALDDLFRYLHPLQKAHTHISVGGKIDQAQRRLDYVLGTHELVQPGTRMGIHAGYTLDGDHLPVICDLHINSAGLAPRPVPTWQPHTCSKLKLHPEITTKMASDFNDLFRHLNTAQEPLTPTQSHPQTQTQTLSSCPTSQTSSCPNSCGVHYPRVPASVQAHTVPRWVGVQTIHMEPPPPWSHQGHPTP